MNAAQTAYNLAFQISPIILTGGIAQSIPGGVLPVLQLLGLTVSALTSANADFPYYFLPVLSGTRVINQSVALYPFANNQVAANATVVQPNPVSMMMVAPVNDTSGYATKLPMFIFLQRSFAQHNASGGTYTVLMPSFLFTNCIMTGMTDITQNSKQQQIEWRIDFVQPLISMAAASTAYSSLMQQITDGNQSASSSWSGTAPTVGSTTAGGVQTYPYKLPVATPVL